MNLSELVLLLNSGVTILIAIGTIWNGYQHKSSALMLTEMQLNMRREFNGRYLSLAQFKEFKEGFHKEHQ